MLDFKNKNKFISTDARSHYAILEVLKFYDIIGINYIYIDIISSVSTILSTLVNSRRLSCTISDLEKIVSENSFRLDLIVIQNFENYYIDTSFTDIPIILLQNTSLYLRDKNRVECTYIFSVDESNLSAPVSVSLANIATTTVKTTGNTRYIIEDVDNNWSASLDDLKIRYIRNKKLEDLFGL